MSIDRGTRIDCTREEFEKIFSSRWINESKMVVMHTIQDELDETKEKKFKLQKESKIM
jgi:hypothetical protein